MLRPLRVRSGSDAPSSGPARATRNLAGLRSSFPAPARPPPARAPRSPAGPPAPGVRPRAAHSPRAPSAARAPLGSRPGRAQGGRAHRPGRGRGRLPAAEFSWEWSRGRAGGRRRWTHPLPARAGRARPAGGRRPRAALPAPAARSRVRPAGPRGARAPPRALRPASPRRCAAPRPPQPAPGASPPSACRAAPSLQARCRFNSCVAGGPLPTQPAGGGAGAGCYGWASGAAAPLRLQTQRWSEGRKETREGKGAVLILPLTPLPRKTGEIQQLLEDRCNSQAQHFCLARCCSPVFPQVNSGLD